MAGVKILYGVEKALENFLHIICDDYNLDYDELYDRYFLPKGDDRNEAESSELPDGIPASVANGTKMTNKTKAKAKPTASNGSIATNATNRKLCCALTTKKTPCKKFAIDGTDFCSCHSNGGATKSVTTANRNLEPSDMDDDATSSAKKKITGKSSTKGKGKSKAKSPQPVIQEPVSEGSDMDSDNEDSSTSKPKGKNKKKDSFPVHTHPVDTEDNHDDCDLCNDVGNSMAQDNDNDDSTFELEAEVKTRLKNILASIDENDSGSETGEDDDK